MEKGTVLHLKNLESNRSIFTWNCPSGSEEYSLKSFIVFSQYYDYLPFVMGEVFSLGLSWVPLEREYIMLTLADTCTMVLEMKIFKNRSMYFHFGFGISQYFVRAKIDQNLPIGSWEETENVERDRQSDGWTDDGQKLRRLEKVSIGVSMQNASFNSIQSCLEMLGFLCINIVILLLRKNSFSITRET